MKKSAWSRYYRQEAAKAGKASQGTAYRGGRYAALCALAVLCMLGLCACKKETPVTTLPTVQRQETTAPETTAATEPEVTEEPTQEPKGHPAEFYYGTWKISKYTIRGVTLSVDEWIKLGADPSIRDCFIVFQDTGKCYLPDGTTGDWEADESGVSIDTVGIPAEDDMLVMDMDDRVLYLEKVSQDQTVPQTEAPTEETTASGLRPEFKQAMDSYESFYNEYVDLLNQYKANPTDFSILAKYMTMLSKLEEIDAAFKAWDSSDMTPEELKYYLEVSTRIQKKLVDLF